MRADAWRRRAWLAALLVAALTAAVFSAVLQNGFVNWEENYIITGNPHVRALTWPNLRWMFSTTYMNTYQPLGWLGYALIVSAQGIKPWGFHWASLLLHSANAAALFLLTLHLLGPFYPSSGRVLLCAGGAALFWSLHPLQVDAVAWASALGSLLSASFFLCSLLAYLAHAERRRLPLLALSWVLFAAAGLARWKALCLPVILLILDAFPLRRRAWSEKLPFFALALPLLAANAGSKNIAPGVTQWATPEQACHRILFFLEKLAWPSGLLPTYTLSSADGRLWGAGAAAVLALTGLLIFLRRKWPAGLAAWTAYLAALAPIAAFAPRGLVLNYNHYAYISCLSIAPLLAGAGLRAPRRLQGLALGLGLCALAGLAVLTRRQAALWHDSITLWTYTLSVDPQSTVAHINLGTALLEGNRLEEAAKHFRRAVALSPDDAIAHHDLDDVLSRLKRRPGLKAQREAEIGIYLYQSGRIEEAIARLRAALSIDPNLEEAHNNLGIALYRQGEVEEAVSHFRRCLEINPGFADAHNNLGIALARQGNLPEAEAEFRRALAIDPFHAGALDNLRLAAEARKTLHP